MGKWDRTIGVYDRTWKNALFDTIDFAGKTIEVMFRTNTACGCPVDPINNESMYNCATCEGQARIYSDESRFVKAVVQKFAGNLRYVREGQTRYQIEPEGDARITMKLSDALVNINVSTSSAIIFKDCKKVIADGDFYKPKDWKRFGVKSLDILEVTLERIREES
jgi:hypothetical protein